MESTCNLRAALESNARLYDPEHYQAIVGCLMYVMIGTRPDLAFPVSVLSRFNAQPTIEHNGAAKRVLRYLQSTKDHGIVYQGTLLKAAAYSDSDWANDKDTRKSTNGYAFKLCNGAVVWKSRKQSTVALSTTEAEYVGYSEAAKEAIWIRRLLMELDLQRPLSEDSHGYESKWGQRPATIQVDSQGALDLANSSKHHDQTKHIDIKHHFIRDTIEKKLIDLTRIPSTEQTADILTKPLARARFEEHRRGMGIIPLYSCNELSGGTLPAPP